MCAIQKVRRFVKHHSLFRHYGRAGHTSAILITLSVLVLVLASCGGSNTPSTLTPGTTATASLASSQVLTFPNVGTADIGTMDPALGPDANSAVAVGMVYTGL